MKVLTEHKGVPIRVWTDDIEPSALKQLQNLASLPFITQPIAVMPDVHAGVGSTIGTVFLTEDVIIPAAVGVDIGCGMSAIPLGIKLDKAPLDTFREVIEAVIPVGFNAHPDYHHLNAMEKRTCETMPRLTEELLFVAKHYTQMGTLGGGNHFIEVSADQDENMWLVLHSGSRGIGNKIGQMFIRKAKELCKQMHIQLPDPDLSYFSIHSDLGIKYKALVSWAQQYAFINRRCMLRLILEAFHWQCNLDTVSTPWFATPDLVECHHNYMDTFTLYGDKEYIITRKGAVDASKGRRGIIPGSMGAKSYLVRGLGSNLSYNSCSHGAGRRMSRTQAKHQFSLADLEAQTLGVLCRKDEGVLDEIPDAYKDIDEVMNNQSDLVEITHTLKQHVCVKG